MFKPNVIKRRLAGSDRLFGVWVETGSATNAEILACQGYDFVLLDLEHGQGDLGDMIGVLRVLRSCDTPCLVRVPWNDPVLLKRVLDAGADSIMIPSIDTPEQAAAAVRACRYPPRGRRGYAAPIVRASGYGRTSDYMSRADDELLLVIQIESAEAVSRAAEICAIDGVDVPFIGVNDLAGSIGLLEQLHRPEVRALVAAAEQAMRGAGKPMGSLPNADVTWQDLFESGYQLVVVGSDVSLMRDAAAASVGEFRRYVHGKQPSAPTSAAADGASGY